MEIATEDLQVPSREEPQRTQYKTETQRTEKGENAGWRSLSKGSRLQMVEQMLDSRSYPDRQPEH